MLPYILTDNSLTIVVDGKALTMESSNPSFNEATKLLAEERFDELPDLFDVPKAVEKVRRWQHLCFRWRSSL